MKPSEHPQMPSNEMPAGTEDSTKVPFKTEDKNDELAMAKEEFDAYLRKLCAAEDDLEVILDRLHEAKNDAFHVGRYKLMAMLGDEIEKRETMEENEEDFEEAVA